MKNTLLIYLLFISSECICQFSGVRSDKHSEILGTTTLVALTENKEYNDFLKTAVISNWSLTKYKFIPSNKVSYYLKQKGYTMLIPIRKTMYGESGIAMVDNTYLTLIKSGKGNLNALRTSDWYSFVSMNCDDGCAYRFELALRTIQYNVKAMNNSDLKGSYKSLIAKQQTLAIKKAKELKSATLYLKSEYFKAAAISEFVHLYPYDIKFVTEEEFYHCDYLNNNIFLLVNEYLPNSQIVIYNVKTGEPVYAVIEKLTNKKGKLNQKAIQKLIKEIQA